jgi:hypothetical protein
MNPTRRSGRAALALVLGTLGLLAGCGEPEPEPVTADIRGVITALTPAGEPGGGLGSVRIEGAKQPDTRYDKASVRITSETRVFQQLGDFCRPLTFADLALGDKVEASFTGPVAESYPVQATASEVVILFRLGQVPPAEQPGQPTPAEPADTTPSDFEGFEDEIQEAREETAPTPGTLPPIPVLREVRTGLQEGFDRVVFEFAGDKLPEHKIEYVDQPVRCGSGMKAEVAGKAWLQVQLRPAQAHDEKGAVTVKSVEWRPKLHAVREIQLICDFEADVTWILGLDQKREHKVLELTDPPRVVVDVTY